MDTDKDLCSFCMPVCEYYVKHYPLEMMHENYENLVKIQILENLKLYKDENILKMMDDENLETSIESIIDEYLNNHYVKRCYGKTYMTHSLEDETYLVVMKDKLNYLKNIEQPEQRTTEWYEFRYNHLTASNLWKVFGTKSSMNQLIYEKCQPLNTEKYKAGFAETPMSWGHKYEDVSIMVYEKMYNTKIFDYGCIPHKHHDYIAASPDGINDDVNSPLFGRMLEIKNIYNRKITGIPKKEYWIQMQLQMEVCDLDECDFLETRFIEYESYDAFMMDGSFEMTESGNKKGVMLYIIDKVNECPKYVYMPLGLNESEYKSWEQEQIELHTNDQYEWFKTIFWRLDQLSCVLVKRNRHWFEEAAPKLKEIWEIIKKEREDGSYVNRAPKRNKKIAEKPKNGMDNTLNGSGQLNDALIVIT